MGRFNTWPRAVQQPQLLLLESSYLLRRLSSGSGLLLIVGGARGDSPFDLEEQQTIERLHGDLQLSGFSAGKLMNLPSLSGKPSWEDSFFLSS